MSIYRELLLSAGGGVISYGQSAEQATCATIAIGLGGTGIRCLKNLKKQIYANVQPDNPAAAVPTYQHIKFLAVDSDRDVLSVDNGFYSLDEETEFFNIAPKSIVWEALSELNPIEEHPELDWLKIVEREKDGSVKSRGLKILPYNSSPGAVRQIGRLLIMLKSAEFVRKIEQLIHEAKIDLPGGSDVNIHIFTGMGGGTGSGIFLDVCYLVQKALQNRGDWGHAVTCGYFFLPDVNLSVPAVSANPAISEYIKVNGFAAMKELDYCMNFENNGGKWDQQYMGFHVGPISEPPVKICHVVSAATTSGADLRNGYDYAMNVVSDFIMQFVVKNDITMNSHIVNCFRAMGNVRKQHGANYTYCLLGASNAVVPMKEITTYLSSKLFEEMPKLGGTLPTDGEIADIAKNNGLTYQQLKKSILDKTSCWMPMPELDMKLFGTMSEEDLGMQGQIILPETIMRPFEQIQENMVNRIETNMQALTQKWSWNVMAGDHTSVSKVCKIYSALASVVSDPKCGPLYAAVALNGAARKNLVSHLHGVLAQTQEEHGNYTKNIDLRCEEIKRARTAFLHPKMMANRKKLFVEFVARVQRYYSDDSMIKMLEKLESMIQTMITQFTKLYEDCFEVYAKVSQNLTDTFHENYQTLSNKETKEAVADPFVIPLMTIEDMKDSLDATVNAMKLEDEMTAFHSELFRCSDIWKGGDEKKITKKVSNYLINKFSGYTQKTLTDYLQIRFETEDAGELTGRIYKEILLPLSDRATPLFWKEASYQITTASPLGYCSVPDQASAIQAAARKMTLANLELQQIKSKLADRIFLLRCTCGVPMFAYAGIEKCEESYKADLEVGKHLYERTNRDSRDWRNLPEIIPFSWRKRKDERTSVLYDRAIKEGIIRQNQEKDWKSREYQIAIMPSVEWVIEEAKAAMWSGSIEQIDIAKQDLETLIADVKPEQLINIGILDDGMWGHEEIVRKDYVLAFPELIKLISQELEKKKQLEDTLRDIEEAKNNIIP